MLAAAGSGKFHISIQDLFATMNTKQLHHGWNADHYYNVVHTAPGRLIFAPSSA